MGTIAHSDDLRSRVVEEISGRSFTAAGCGALQGERGLGHSLGSTPQPNGRRSPPAAGRQKPLPARAACGLAAGPDPRGAGPDAGSDCGAPLGRSWIEDFGGCGSPLLQATRDHLQKKRCTPPNRIGPTYPRRVNAGKQARRASTPPSWCSSMRRAPIPRWSASMDGVERASVWSARLRGDIGRPQPSPAACAAMVCRALGTGKPHDR